VSDRPETPGGQPDMRHYDVEHYLRVLKDTYASRLVRAFAPADFAALFADPDQASLFPPAYGEIQSVMRGV
jgi:DNA polymerase, archaea type